MHIVREPINHYQPQAVRVTDAATTSVILHGNDNTAVSQFLDWNEKLTVQIVSLKDRTSAWDRICLAVYLKE